MRIYDYNSTPWQAFHHRRSLMATTKHLLMMLGDEGKPAKLCRREIKNLCQRLARLYNPLR